MVWQAKLMLAEQNQGLALADIPGKAPYLMRVAGAEKWKKRTELYVGKAQISLHHR